MDKTKVQKACWCYMVFNIILETADLISDWLFYIDVKSVKKGLVFGPHDPNLVLVVLVFTIIGTVVWPLQIYVTVKERLNKGNETGNRLNFISLAIILIEDIPQAVILLLISLCREDPQSIWAITKASFMLVTSLIKCVENLIDCMKKKCWTLKGIIFLLGLVEMAIVSVVFLATQTERSADGSIHIEKPKSVIEEKYNENSYFSNISIFIHDPNLIPSNASPPPAEPYFIRLESINEIQKYEYINFTLEYETNKNGINNLKISEKKVTNSATDPWTVTTSCYYLNDKYKGLTVDPKICLLTSQKTLHLTFKYIKPERFFKNYLIGDITFNAEYKTPGMRQGLKLTPSLFTEDIRNRGQLNDVEGSRIKLKGPIILHYFKNQNIPSNNAKHVLKQDIDNSFQLFKQTGGNLIDVKGIWKTGWSKCETTGNLGPRFDKEMNVVI